MSGFMAEDIVFQLFLLFVILAVIIGVVSFFVMMRRIQKRLGRVEDKLHNALPDKGAKD